MGNYQTVTLAANQTLRITLRRIVAKVDVSVNVASSVSSQISLQSISLVNAPNTCRYFGANTPTIGFMEYEARKLTSGSRMSYYLLENRQGVNNSITHQKYKSRENAPGNGSYLHIRALTKSNWIDYYIFLGENNTTDFNVSRNKIYSLVVNIQGISETDWRVEVSDPKSITVTLSQVGRTAVTYAPPNQVWQGSDNTLTVTVTLSQPSEWDISVPIQGVFFLNDIYTVFTEDQSKTNGFFSNVRVTIPAGTKKVTTKFYEELRVSKGQSATHMYSHCTITRFIRNPKDINNYTYLSGYVPWENVNSYTVVGWPKT